MRLVGAQEERLALEVFFFFFSTLAKFVFSSVLSLSKFDLKKKKGCRVGKFIQGCLPILSSLVSIGSLVL